MIFEGWCEWCGHKVFLLRKVGGFLYSRMLFEACKLEISSFDRFSFQTRSFSFFQALSKGKCMVLSMKPIKT